MRRDERKVQEELAGTKKIELSMTKAQRMVKLREHEDGVKAAPRRIARVGKPLKR